MGVLRACHAKNPTTLFAGISVAPTAPATNRHLTRYLVYVDFNMVRAALGDHPSKWKVCGFDEIHSRRSRYRFIDMETFCELTGATSADAFRLTHQGWVKCELARGESVRQAEWTEAAAVEPVDVKAAFQASKMTF